VKTSIKQLSEMTGFSSATISNALNNKKGVNKQTSDLILKAAVEAGYVNDAKITSIRFIVYRKHGRVVADTPFFAGLISGVENECRACGYDTVIVHLDKTDENFYKLLDQILKDRTTANMVLATEFSEKDAEPFKKAACPVIMLDCWFEDMSFDAVIIDNTDSVYNSASYLIKNGHEKIGYLKSSTPIKNFYYREIGYRRAMTRAGLQINPNYTVSLTPSMDGSYRDMSAYLEKHKDLPTAFCADNDNIALGACKALQEHGYHIPKDISIIGFDDMPFCEISSPPLTTIRVFKQEMGAFAVRRLVSVIKSGSTIKTKTQICTEFVERESVRRLFANEKEND
jgi:DNA-binding LacI/PurR family transcriptional regulator